MVDKRNDTLAAASAERVKTPLTDSWQASLPKGVTPGIFPIMWREGFAVGHGTKSEFYRALEIRKYSTPRECDGKKNYWTVLGVDFAEDQKTVLKVWLKVEGWFENEKQAETGLPKCLEWAKAEANKKIAVQVAADAHRPSSDEQDLAQARLKVMREQYPDTFNAMDILAKAKLEARPAAVEALFRAYAVDLVRLHKPANLGDISPFKSLPADANLLIQIANAYNAKSPRDPVDVEIAARWFAAGYDKMSLAEYTQVINTKTGANLKPATMEARRYKKLGLMTKKKPGPLPKS